MQKALEELSANGLWVVHGPGGGTGFFFLYLENPAQVKE